jgi:transposase-like protein
MKPASTIIEALGGAAAVARIVGVHRTSVYRWTWRKSEGGTGGTIPASHIGTIIAFARQKNLNIQLEHFFGDMRARK